MEVVYVGNFEQGDGTYAAPFNTESCMARGLEQNGVRVIRVQHPSSAWPKRRIDDGLDAIQLAAEDADLLVYQGSGLPLEATGLWRVLERAGCRTASYHLDLYVGLKRESMITTDPFWRTGTVFTADGDPRSAERFKLLDVNHRWLCAGVDELEGQTDGRRRDRFDHDVVFVGARGYHQEWPWRRQLIGFLQQRYGRRLGIYDHHPPVRGLELNDLYATARVVVGDSLCLPGHVNYWSDRFYETVGRGGVLVGPRVPGLHQHLLADIDFIGYDIGNIDSVGERVDWALEHHDEARERADNGRSHVLDQHTYRHRAREMLHSLGFV